MIDIPASPAAAVAANARAAIDKATAELAALQADSEQARAEMRELLAERATWQSRRDDLAATVAAAKSDLERARLAEEVSQSTGLERQAQEATERASALWSDAHADEQQQETAWLARAPEIEARLTFLEKSISEAAQMSQSLQARMETLRGVYDTSHSQHGKDEQTRLEAEFAAIVEKRAAKEQQLEAIDQEEAALRSQILERLASWPSLARECLSQHLDYQPSPLHQALEHWEHAARLLGDHARTVDWQTWQAHMGQIPAWHLVQYGPRAAYIHRPAKQIDEPLRMYEKMLADLCAALSHLEASERERQVNERLREQGL